MENMAAAVRVRVVPSLGMGNALSALEARVLELLRSDGHRDVIGPAATA